MLHGMLQRELRQRIIAVRTQTNGAIEFGPPLADQIIADMPQAWICLLRSRLCQ